MRKIINHWLKWTVLSDNRSDDSRLSTEHGLSILLQTTNEREQCDACINIAERGCVRRSQTERHKILLDTGASDVFIRNAEQLGIDLSDVDYVFISSAMWTMSSFLTDTATMLAVYGTSWNRIRRLRLSSRQMP